MSSPLQIKPEVLAQIEKVQSDLDSKVVALMRECLSNPCVDTGMMIEAFTKASAFALSIVDPSAESVQITAQIINDRFVSSAAKDNRAIAQNFFQGKSSWDDSLGNAWKDAQ